MTNALLIIDVQRGLCEGRWAMFEADRVVQCINRLSTQARASGQCVIFVQHEELSDGLVHGSQEWQLAQGLHTREGDRFLRKRASDAFHDTGLQALLQELGVTHLTVCGMQTDYCVDSTVRRALDLGYAVTLIADAHTTLDDDAVSAAQLIAHHNRVLSSLGGYAHSVKLVTTANWLTQHG